MWHTLNPKKLYLMKFTVSNYLNVLCLGLITLLMSCKNDMNPQSENILLQEWEGPYGEKYMVPFTFDGDT